MLTPTDFATLADDADDETPVPPALLDVASSYDSDDIDADDCGGNDDDTAANAETNAASLICDAAPADDDDE